MKRMSLLILSAAAALTVQAAITVTPESPYTESFETDLAGWTNEFVNGTLEWKLDQGNSEQQRYGSAAADGDYNLLLFSETRGYVTRLVSPVFDLSQLTNPSLSFKYANENWSQDQDVLEVLYRENSGAEWQVLSTMEAPVPVWVSVGIDLPGNSATAQIAFAGHSNYGYGIAIDKVRVSETTLAPPVCLSTEAFFSSIALTWSNHSAAQKTQLVISTVEMLDAALESAAKVELTGADNYEFTSLDDGTLYYIYMRSLNGSEVTDWTGVSAYTIPRNIGPYKEGDNIFVASPKIVWHERPLVNGYQMVVSQSYMYAEELELQDKISIAYTETSYLLTDLELGTTYYVFIRPEFGDIGYGNWEYVSITRPYSHVLHLNVNNLTPSSATITWDKWGDEDHWLVVVSNQNDLTDEQLYAQYPETVDHNSYQIDGLNLDDTRTVYVRPLIGQASIHTQWSQITFVADDVSHPVVVTGAQPYLEGFETISSDWTATSSDEKLVWRFGDGLQTKTEIYNYPTSDYDFARQIFDGKQNAYASFPANTGGSCQLISPEMDITSLDAPMLRFAYMLPKWSSDLDELRIYYRLDPGDPWIEFNRMSEDRSEWMVTEMPLPEKSSTFQLMFEDISGYGYGVAIDNVSVFDAMYVNVQEPAAFDIRIQASKGHLSVEGTSGEVQVCSLTGQLLAKAQGESLRFDLPSQALYLVITQEGAYKVFVP
ncbi:MAG: choice-of-anchor J domain-containing protein [Paludibacteraceae bacterium]|nr:choice-of-anchor J domain-containing protein [Paludibacteraceae bacterium]